MTFRPHSGAFLEVDEQSVHFEANCHRGRSVTVDQKYSGRSVVVQMSLGRSVGGRSVKVPRHVSLIPRTTLHSDSEQNQVYQKTHEALGAPIRYIDSLKQNFLIESSVKSMSHGCNKQEDVRT